jgi:hypothetical protein
MADQDPLKIIEALYGNQPWGTAGGGAGSGFADRDYWLAHPSEILNGRLQSDLLGTGPDQPEGTPGSGVWSNSGKDRQGILTPSGMAQGFWDKPSTAAPSTQSDIVNQSIQNLTPNQFGIGNPMPRVQGPEIPASPDDIMGGYQDELRRQLMDQMKGGI